MLSNEDLTSQELLVLSYEILVVTPLLLSNELWQQPGSTKVIYCTGLHSFYPVCQTDPFLTGQNNVEVALLGFLNYF